MVDDFQAGQLLQSGQGSRSRFAHQPRIAISKFTSDVKMVAQAYSLIIQSLARYHSPISWEFYTVWQADDKKNSEQKRYLFKIAELFHIIFLNWLVFHYYLAPSEVYLLDWNTQPENYPMMKLPKSQVLHRPHLNSKIVCQENNSLSEVIWTLFDLIIQKRKAMGRVCLGKGILTLVTMRAAPSHL